MSAPVATRPHRRASPPQPPTGRTAPPRTPAGSGAPTAPRPRRPKRHGRDALWFLLLAAPNLVLIGAFTYRPLIANVQYSLLQWNLGSSTARFVGLDNYVRFFTSPDMIEVLRVTAVFTIATVGGSLGLGLLVALALTRTQRFTGLARSVAFAPYVLSGVAVGMVWMFIFDPSYGALSGLLRLLGTTGPDWYLDRNAALVMVIIVYVWKNLGYCAVVYLAALQAVPQDVLDAASLDGASARQRFVRITLPLLSPTTFFLLITSTLSSLQSFDLINAMTKGGPLGGTTTLMYAVYEQAFVNGRAGYSAAIATILFVVLLVMTLAQMRYLERKVHYS